MNTNLNILQKYEQNYFYENISMNNIDMINLYFNNINQNACRALNIYNTSGKIEKGKDADLISVLANKFNIYENDLAKSIFTRSNQNQISNLWISGKEIIKSGKLITINENLLYDEFNEWKNKNNYGQR